jgi:DNA processing protein
VEAARRSGSLITARFALEQGREVFAVPGSPMDPRAEGTNDLIRNGATLCAEADHVISVISPMLGHVPEPPAAAREPGPPAFGGARTLWDELDLPELDTASPASVVDYDADERENAAHSGTDGDRILRLLDAAPIGVDDLARQAEMPIRAVQLALLDLELAGRLERHGGNAVSLIEGPAHRAVTQGANA